VSAVQFGNQNCLNCGGIVYGKLMPESILCGAMKSIPPGWNFKRTKCTEMRPTRERWYGSDEPLHNLHALPAFKSRVAALLKEIEYDDGDKCGVTPDAQCPSCRATRRSRRHLPDCELKALLDECAR